MVAKPWWQSKLMWVGFLTILVGILGFLIQFQTASGLPFDIDPRYLLVGQGILIMVLRSVTTQPVSGG